MYTFGWIEVMRESRGLFKYTTLEEDLELSITNEATLNSQKCEIFTQEAAMSSVLADFAFGQLT